jgi:putative tryptophan/tyrosine transport system substrate-binding protein
MCNIRRREFVALLGGAVVARPVAARAQPPAMPVIGFLSSGTPQEFTERLRAFRQSIGEAGYDEGRNLIVEYKWAEGRNDRLPALVAELIRRQVSVIAAAGDPAALSAKAATSTIPIVFVGGGDPMKLGLVASLNRPGGNVTGVTILNVEIAPKRLQMMHELVPQAKEVAVLFGPFTPNTEPQSKFLLEVASAMGLQLHILRVGSPPEIERAFDIVAERRIRALVIGASTLFNSQSRQLGELAARCAVPAIFQTREFAAAGGLVSYGANLADAYRAMGEYAGRLLKGQKPADLPVQQSAKIEMIINLKSAKALDIPIPIPLLGRADEVIE